MKVLINPYRPAFSSTRMRSYDADGNVVNCNYTNLNREDLDWAKFAGFLASRYKNKKNVKINLFGCSDGSDAYTLVLNLRRELGPEAQKFLPIEASDLSFEMIKEANEGKIYLHSKDLDYLRKIGADGDFERDYGEKTKIMRGIEFFPYKVSPKLRKCVDFSVKDIRKASSEDDFSNQVVIFRNGWTFNTLNDQDKIAKNLFKNSSEKTLVVIGQSDLFKSGASDALQRNGFSGIKSEIFTAKETNYPSKSIGQPLTKPVYPEFILFENRRPHEQRIYCY